MFSIFRLLQYATYISGINKSVIFILIINAHDTNGKFKIQKSCNFTGNFFS